MKNLFTVFMAILFVLPCFSQKSLRPGWWRAELKREDGVRIPFNFEVKKNAGSTVLYIRNGIERIKVDQVTIVKDSVFIQMPVFESRFRAQLRNDGSIEGQWIKGTSSKDLVVSFSAKPGLRARFQLHQQKSANVAGRWAALFDSNDPEEKIAVAEFNQQGQKLTGTFLTPTGDYRYLEGIVDGDSLMLSTFDGGHAYLFTARLSADNKIVDGHYYSGARFQQAWTANADPNAKIPDNSSAVSLRKGEERLHFTFPDLDGKLISINDARFRNKVVVIQIMGSWCPNCMDETRFLSDYYRKNKARGVEVVSLAYEYSSDFERSQKSLRKFRDRFNVEYPMLITGVRTSDTLRTEKTLPQITPIKMFPTTIFIGRDGRVKKIDTGFMGPGTGEHYEAYRKEFYHLVDRLLKES